MRVLFFGTAEFALPSLHALMASGQHTLVSVVTQPDKPQGRGYQLTPSPVKRAAEHYGLPVLQPRRVRSPQFLETARTLQPDVFALAAFGQIIPQALLDLPPYGPINVHGSLLPAYRGAAPIQHAILNGETETGVTTMWMDATLDTGDILLKRVVPIAPDDTTGTLTPKMAEAGAELLLETLARLAKGDCPRIPQDSSLATFAPPILPEDSRIRWEESAHRTYSRIRALAPRPGTYTLFADKRLKLWQAEARAESSSEAPGTVRAVSKEGVVVQAGTGTLLLLEVQAENSRRMPAADWARGVRLMSGQFFT